MDYTNIIRAIDGIAVANAIIFVVELCILFGI